MTPESDTRSTRPWSRGGRPRRPSRASLELVAVRLSMPARMRGSISTTVISAPSALNMLANSQPITPPPMTSRLFGASSSTRMSSEVRSAGWSMSSPGSPATGAGRHHEDVELHAAPVDDDRVAVDPARAADDLDLLRLQAASTPPRRRMTMSFLRAIIFGKSNETPSTTRPYSSARRIFRSRSAVARSALVGMHPQFRHVRPGCRARSPPPSRPAAPRVGRRRHRPDRRREPRRVCSLAPFPLPFPLPSAGASAKIPKRRGSAPAPPGVPAGQPSPGLARGGRPM